LVDYYGNTGKQNVTKTAKGRGNPVLFAVSVCRHYDWSIQIRIFKKIDGFNKTALGIGIK